MARRRTRARGAAGGSQRRAAGTFERRDSPIPPTSCAHGSSWLATHPTTATSSTRPRGSRSTRSGEPRSIEERRRAIHEQAQQRARRDAAPRPGRVSPRPSGAEAAGCGSSSSEPPGTSARACSQALERDDAVSSVLGLARRLPAARYAKTEFAAANVVSDDLVPHFAGADCVIHLAWVIQPSRDKDLLWAINVEGSSNVFKATAARPASARWSSRRRSASTRAGRSAASTESSPHEGIPIELVLAPQGGDGAPPRRVRGRAPERARRPAAARPDHEARVRRGGAPALLRPVPAQRARQAGAASGGAAHPGRRRPARPLARRRRGVPARRDP